MRQGYYILVFSIGWFATAGAQDIHFSQYYSSPLTVSPAFTGSFNGDYRAGMNYRTQWASVTVPYRTYSFYGDMSMGRSVFNGNYFTAGLNLVTDRAGDGDLSATRVMASGAFHLIPDIGKKNDLSIGAQAGWVQKHVDYTKLYFDNQWSDGGFDTQIPSGEQYESASTGYMDAAIGLSYTYNGPKKFSTYAALSVYHLFRPVESFYGSDNKLGTRPVMTAGIRYQLSDLLSITPSFYYESQKKAHETLAGAMLRYNLPVEDPSASLALFMGAYGRFGDAVIPAAGFEFRQWRFIMNFDINTSALSAASNGQGAFEVSLVYTATKKRNQRTRIDLPCPRF